MSHWPAEIEGSIALSLLLNFSPLQFDDAEIEAGTFAYGELVLKDLRREHWATHVFRRDGADQIVASPVVENAARLGTGTKTIR